VPGSGRMAQVYFIVGSSVGTRTVRWGSCLLRMHHYNVFFVFIVTIIFNLACLSVTCGINDRLVPVLDLGLRKLKCRLIIGIICWEAVLILRGGLCAADCAKVKPYLLACLVRKSRCYVGRGPTTCWLLKVVVLPCVFAKVKLRIWTGSWGLASTLS
jgi:hypothetical protein